MDSVEFGTRRQEFGAQLLQCSANDFSLKVLSCGDGCHGHIWIFFCDANPPITLLLTFCPRFKFPESDFFIFYSVCLFQIFNNEKVFLPEKIEFTFCWRIISFVSTRGQSLKCFTRRYVGQSCVLPKANPCFANTHATVLSQHLTMFSLWVLSK